MKRSERSKVVMPSELINVAHPFYNSPSVQGAMLFDVVRTEAFGKAIKKIVRNKDVLEIGTGTGILSLFATNFGAQSVTATEAAEETFQTARNTIRNNGFRKKISLIQYKNKPIKFGKKFDVIMSECLGHFAFDENMVSVVAKYKKHLKKGGVFLPRRISLFISLAENADFYKQNINLWNNSAYGFDFSAMKKLSQKRVYIQTFKQKQILSTVGKIINYDLKEKTPYSLKGLQKIRTKKAGIAHGLAGWFSAELADGININTSPLLAPTHWEQCFFPFEKPIKIKKNDNLKITMEIKSNAKSNKVKFSWKLLGQNKLSSSGQAVV
jgi:predicted nicotinamide N-methyase